MTKPSKKTTRKSKTWTWVKKQLQDFFRITPHIILGTGTSCAVDIGFGMTALMENLLHGVEPSTLDPESAAQWEKVKKSLENNEDIEHSLDFAEAPALRERILEITGTSIAELDQKYASRICRKLSEWPAMAIVKQFVEGLSRSEHHGLNVITTNYDLLFEYACFAQGIPCLDGFCGNVIKKEDWPASQRIIRCPTKAGNNKRKGPKTEICSHVNLYKVHGSINWFFLNEEVVSVDMWITKPPPDVERVIITPGSSKYETIQNFRKELESAADKSVELAKGFLFLGYGMNDSHIERYIRREITQRRKPALFITRDLNDRMRSFAEQNSSVWIVCGQDDPNAGTRIFNNKLDGWLQLNGKHLWNFSEFAERMI